jgi:hypothetical protein
MGWFRGKREGKKADKQEQFQHCVIVHLALSSSGFGTHDERESIHKISDMLAEAIMARGAGEFDGDVFGNGECELFMYGRDAGQIFDAISPVLNGWKALKGGYVIKRFGPPGSPSEKVEFS